jgi:beta-N-acetylhexosaminidase
MTKIKSISGSASISHFAGICMVLALDFLDCNSIHAQIKDSLDFKIGQMIMIGVPGTDVDTAVLREIRTGKVGSIIFFEKNVPKINSYTGLKKIAWTYQKAAPVPLLIGIDQEGGKVNRLKEKYGFPRSITAAAMGKSKTLDSVRFYAQSTASNLAGLGININFAPVIDVAVNPDNPVIVKYERSFSASEDSVVLMAKEYIKEHRKVGVITVLKHFPGHGSSSKDTHADIADVTTTWSPKELQPYRDLIDSGYADAVMTAHIVNKVLDRNAYPGTLSNKIIDSLLRKTLGFHGVVFSDDMQMFAIAKQYGLDEAIRLSINAGLDILCFSNNIQGTESRTVDKVLGIIRNFVNTGVIKQERIDQSYHRIKKLKSGLGGKQADLLRKELVVDKVEIIRLKNENEALKKEQEAKPNSKKSKKKKKVKSS